MHSPSSGPVAAAPGNCGSAGVVLNLEQGGTCRELRVSALREGAAWAEAASPCGCPAAGPPAPCLSERDDARHSPGRGGPPVALISLGLRAPAPATVRRTALSRPEAEPTWAPAPRHRSEVSRRRQPRPGEPLAQEDRPRPSRGEGTSEGCEGPAARTSLSPLRGARSHPCALCPGAASCGSSEQRVTRTHTGATQASQMQGLGEAR